MLFKFDINVWLTALINLQPKNGFIKNSLRQPHYQNTALWFVEGFEEFP